MKRTANLVVVFLSSVWLITLLTAAVFAKDAPVTNVSGSKQSNSRQVDGDTVWKQQCSRCHLAPGAINKKKMMTISRHMRDVAQLTYEDYQVLKEFLGR